MRGEKIIISVFSFSHQKFFGLFRLKDLNPVSMCSRNEDMGIRNRRLRNSGGNEVKTN